MIVNVIVDGMRREKTGGKLPWGRHNVNRISHLQADSIEYQQTAPHRVTLLEIESTRPRAGSFRFWISIAPVRSEVGHVGNKETFRSESTRLG